MADELIDVTVGFQNGSVYVVRGVPKDSVLKMSPKGQVRDGLGSGVRNNYCLTIAKPGVYSGKDDIASFDGVRYFFVSTLEVTVKPKPVNGTETWLDGFVQ